MDIPDSPIKLGFSDKFPSWRDYQEESIQEIIDSDKSLFILDAPCGSGKSLTAMSVARLSNAKVYYVVSTKQLQDQILGDFPFAKKVIGRSNFTCQHGLLKLTCAEGLYCSTGLACPERGTCPYYMQKESAMESQFCVMNYSYFLTAMNYAEDWDIADLIIFDEGHLMESELFKQVGISLSPKNFHDYDFTFPGSEDICLERVEDLYDYLKEEISDIKGKRQMSLLMELTDDLSVSDAKDLKKMEILYKKISFVLKHYNEGWVLDYKRVKEFKNSRVTFKPIMVNDFAYMYFKHGSKFLVQSATMPPVNIFCRGFGINQSDVGYKEVHSTFPRENSPVIYRPVGKLSYAHIDENLPKAINEIYNIVSQNMDKKILIHTANYRISREIGDTIVILDEKENKVINVRVFGHDNAGERLAALEDFKSAEAPAILSSPSFETGVDLPYEQCEVQIIVKIPFLSLGDKQTKKRAELDREWYISATINRLEQACGRGVRAEDDTCITYILDECFKGLAKQYSYMFKEWFSDRICVEVEE